jgi:hypothetical protein
VSAAARWLPAWVRRLINQVRLSGAEYKLKLMQDEILHLQLTLHDLPADIDWLRRHGGRGAEKEIVHMERDLAELPSYIAWLQRHEAAQAVIVTRLQAAVRPVAQRGEGVRA